MSRYIDADELIKTISSTKFTSLGANDILVTCCQIVIDNAPTADVRENVKGEWIEKKPMNFGKCVNGFGSIFICSVCGEEISCCTTKYCPNCGADMRPITALSENAEIDSNLKRGKS